MSKRGQSKGERADKPKVDWKALEVVHPHAAGIDVGGCEHWVAISPEKDEEPVRRFDCFTADVEQMADWLADLPGRKSDIAECQWLLKLHTSDY